MRRFGIFFAAVMLCVGLVGYVVAATETNTRFYDASVIRSRSSTCTIDTADGNFATLLPFVTIEPQNSTGMQDVKVTMDLDYTTTGFADGYTSQTIQFCVGRKVDGTNWRIDAEEATTAISGTNADALGSRSVTLDVGTVLPNEDCRIYVVLSAEGAANIVVPYLVTYRSQAQASFTDID